MKVARLILGTLSSLTAGAVTSFIAPSRTRLPWVPGAITLAVFISGTHSSGDEVSSLVSPRFSCNSGTTCGAGRSAWVGAASVMIRRPQERSRQYSQPLGRLIAPLRQEETPNAHSAKFRRCDTVPVVENTDSYGRFLKQGHGFLWNFKRALIRVFSTNQNVETFSV
jgi:hypothetical protein